MSIILKSHKNLKINEIESLLINLCPIYRYQDSSPTTRPMRIYEQKCFIREIKDIEIPAVVQYKTDQWPLTKNKTWLNMATLDQCAGQMKSLEPWGKVKTMWTREIKPISMIQAVHM